MRLLDENLQAMLWLWKDIISYFKNARNYYPEKYDLYNLNINFLIITFFKI